MRFAKYSLHPSRFIFNNEEETMSNVPQELRYTKTHEWVKREDDGSLTIGITDHAQGLLGDLVFVEVPEEGDTFNE